MLKDRIAATGAVAMAAMCLAAPVAAQDQAQQQQALTDRRETMESAVETPAVDLNLKQTPIPEVLQRATVNAYDMRTLETCPAIAAEMQRLDAALGPDRDEPPAPDNRTVEEKREGGAAAALKLGIEAVTPYRGIIRWATGATAYAQTVQAAIEAGFARRGFLKGMAVKMNCLPPASPAWFRPAPRSLPTPQPVYSAPQDYRAYPAPRQTYSTAQAYTTPQTYPTEPTEAYDDEVAPAPRYAEPQYDRYDGRSYQGYYRTYRSDPDDRAYPTYQTYRDDRYARDYDR